MSWHISKALMDNYENSHSSQEQAAGYLAENFSDGEPSVPSKSNPTPQAYLCSDRMTAFLTCSLYGMIFAPLTEDLGEELLTWFLGGFPAKTYQLQEKAQGLTGRDLASGRKWPASLAKFDPSTCSWRIAQHSLFGDLAEFSETWPRWGTMRNGECWALSMPGLHTSGNASGLWRTPSAREPGVSPERLEPIGGGTPGGMNRHFDKHTGRMVQIGLMQQVKLREMWPTPNCPNGGRSVKHVTDWRGKSAYHNGKKVQVGLEAAVKMWPTPTRSDGAGGPGCSGRAGGLNLRTAVTTVPTPTVHGNYNRKGLTKNSGDGLATFVAKFPTPCASDYKSGKGKTQQERGRTAGQSLSEFSVGQLNPDWVEWLMGWPVGWSNLGPLDTADIALWENEPQGVPRVASGVKARACRLRAIGNGQVPQCMALAWNILCKGIAK